MSNLILRSLRQMAWQRAKGELLSLGCTFWTEDPEWPGDARKLSDAIEAFINHVEDEGWHE